MLRASITREKPLCWRPSGENRRIGPPGSRRDAILNLKCGTACVGWRVRGRARACATVQVAPGHGIRPRECSWTYKGARLSAKPDGVSQPHACAAHVLVRACGARKRNSVHPAHSGDNARVRMREHSRAGRCRPLGLERGSRCQRCMSGDVVRCIRCVRSRQLLAYARPAGAGSIPGARCVPGARSVPQGWHASSSRRCARRRPSSNARSNAQR